MFGSTEGAGVAQFSQFLPHTLITGTFLSFVNAFWSGTSVPLLTRMTWSIVITEVLFWHITTKQTVLAQDGAIPYNHNAVYIQKRGRNSFYKSWHLADENGRCLPNLCESKTLVQPCTACKQNIDPARSCAAVIFFSSSSSGSSDV